MMAAGCRDLIAPKLERDLAEMPTLARMPVIADVVRTYPRWRSRATAVGGYHAWHRDSVIAGNRTSMITDQDEGRGSYIDGRVSASRAMPIAG